MKKFRVIASLLLPAGIRLELSKKQFEDRSHLVEKQGKCCVAKEMLHFKAGEVVGICDPDKLSKAALLRLEEDGKPKAEPPVTSPAPDPEPTPPVEEEEIDDSKGGAFNPLDAG